MESKLRSTEAIVLAAHEPVRDPRIDWVASSLAKKMKTVVIGFEESDLSYAGKPYDVLRYPKQNKSITQTNYKEFLKLLFRPSLPAFYFLFPILFVGLALTFALKGLAFVGTKIVRVFLPQNSIRNLYYFKNKSRAQLQAKFNFFANMKWLIKHFLISEVSLVKPDDHFPALRLIYANDLDSLFAAIRIKRQAGNPQIKIIYDNHEFFSDAFKGAPWWHRLALEYIERCLLPYMDEIIIVTPQLAQHFKKVHHVGREIFVLPNFGPLEEALTPTFSKGERALTFLFQGNFTDGRGLIELIRFWGNEVDTLKDCKLLMRGPDNMFRQSCIRLAQDLGLLNKTVFFPDAVAEDQLIATACEADVGVIPYQPLTINNKFCCPNKLSQYMQAGLVILTNNLPFVVSQIKNGDCGLAYSDQDPKSFATAIKALVTNPDLVEQYKRNSRKTALESCNWTRCEEILLSLT